jgi:hypothetical protein
MRQYNENEVKAFIESEPVLEAMLLDVSNSEAGTKNAQLIRNYFDTNPNVPVTLENIKWLVQHETMKPQLTWKSLAAHAFDGLGISPAELQTVLSWITSQNYLVREGDLAIENCLACVKFLKDRNYAISASNLQMAVTNITGHSKVKLHFVEHKAERTSLLHNHAKDAAQEAKTDNKYLPDGRVNHARDTSNFPAHQSESSIRARLDADAQAKAELVRGRTHGHTATIQRIFVTRQGTSDIDWSATLSARVRAAGVV